MGIQNAAISGSDGTWIQSYNQPATAAGSFALMLNPLGGNVGIGTTSPNAVLDIAIDAAVLNYPRIYDSRTQAIDRGGKLSLGGYSDSLTTITSFGQIVGAKTNATSGNTSGYLSFLTNSGSGLVESLRLASTGAATFSSSVTATSLSIASNTGGITLNRTGTSNYSTILYQSAAADKWYVGMRENNATSDYILYNATNNTDTLRISIATGAATFSSLGTGAVTATGGTLSTTSDMNLKVEDGFIDNALDKVLKLTPRYFLWKEESGLPTDLRQLGFYAQEVNEALGEEVANTPKEEDGKWGIYDRGMIAMLTKAIQELSAQVEELKARLDYAGL